MKNISIATGIKIILASHKINSDDFTNQYYNQNISLYKLLLFWQLTTMRHIIAFSILLAQSLFIIGCTSAEKIVDPIATDRELPTGSLESVGLINTHLENASSRIAAEEDHQLHSMLVVRNGVLVYEEYYNRYERENPHDLRSATKSITSLLTGIAIDQGHITEVDAPMMDYLAAEYPEVDDKGNILIEHLLTMRSGLDCDDSDHSTVGQEDRMYRSEDWVEYFLSLSRPFTPGETTRYCTGGVVAIGEVIAQGSGQDFAAFADDVLLSPLGIENYRWARFDDEQKVDSGGHLFLTPQAMAKIGMLVLQRGEWDGQQIVSAEWIERSTQPKTEIGEVPYGYLWWSDSAQFGEKSVEIIYARGNGGQTIFIVPEYDLVAVFTAGYYNSEEARIVFDLFGNVVLPSILDLQEYIDGSS